MAIFLSGLPNILFVDHCWSRCSICSARIQCHTGPCRRACLFLWDSHPPRTPWWLCWGIIQLQLSLRILSRKVVYPRRKNDFLLLLLSYFIHWLPGVSSKESHGCPSGGQRKRFEKVSEKVLIVWWIRNKWPSERCRDTYYPLSC